MKPWGQQNIRCVRCKNKTVLTYETREDQEMPGAYCVRWFERLCRVCLYWSAFILLNNGQDKITIGSTYEQ